jgi:hypothetical protein
MTFCFWYFETGYHCVDQPGLELMVYLHQPPQCWDYRYVPHTHQKAFLQNKFKPGAVFTPVILPAWEKCSQDPYLINKGWERWCVPVIPKLTSAQVVKVYII